MFILRPSGREHSPSRDCMVQGRGGSWPVVRSQEGVTSSALSFGKVALVAAHRATWAEQFEAILVTPTVI